MVSWFSVISLQLLPPDVTFEGKNAPESILARAPLQTPLVELTALPRSSSSI